MSNGFPPWFVGVVVSADTVTEPLPTGRYKTWIAWGAAGVWGTWALIRLTGADRLPGLGRISVPILSLTPYMAASAPLAVVGALLLRDRRAAAVSAAAMIGFGFALAPRALADPAPDAHGPRLRVMSANLMFGRAPNEDVVRLVREHRVDVLSLQEFTPDSHSGLSEVGLGSILPHKVTDARWGPGGTAIYSRLPLTPLGTVDGTRMAHPRAGLDLEGRKIEITGVHPSTPLRSEGYKDWKHTLATLPGARDGGAFQILMGDFNATLDHARFRGLVGRGYTDSAESKGQGLVPSWGVSMMGPPLTLDHILVPSEVAVRSYSVRDLDGTDHRPLLAELQLP